MKILTNRVQTKNIDYVQLNKSLEFSSNLFNIDIDIVVVVIEPLIAKFSETETRK